MSLGGDIELVSRIPSGCLLGEGVLYDVPTQCFFWTDIVGLSFHVFDLQAHTHRIYPTPRRLCSFALTPHTGWILAAFDKGFAHYHWQSAQIRWKYDIEPNLSYLRLNDGRVGPDGVFWVGSMVEHDGMHPVKGALHGYTASGDCLEAIPDIVISNSLCWSPDGLTAYHADTPSQVIKKYCYGAQSPYFVSAEEFIRTEAGCFPDGSCTDAHGNLWNAQWGGSRVMAYSPNGQALLKIDLPVSQPTCVSFGGDDFNLLAVTSARQGLSQEQLLNEPFAGDTFIFKTRFTGRPEMIADICL